MKCVYCRRTVKRVQEPVCCVEIFKAEAEAWHRRAATPSVYRDPPPRALSIRAPERRWEACLTPAPAQNQKEIGE